MVRLKALRRLPPAFFERAPTPEHQPRSPQSSAGGARERGLKERTTLVVKAHHGDELLEHGHVGHAPTAHHATLHEQVLRIPLLVIDARLSGRRVAARVHGMDLFPTLLGLAGMAAPAPSPGPFGAHGGVDLGPLLVGEAPELAARLEARTFYFHSARMGCPTPRERAAEEVEGIADARFKLVVERFDAPRRLLYDLVQDPQELRPVLSGTELEERAERLLQVRAPARAPGQQGPLIVVAPFPCSV